MTTLTLNLTKPGEQAPKLALNLKKNEIFTVRLGWDGEYDLDLHALYCVNRGAGAKLNAVTDILSTYNVEREINKQMVGSLPKSPDGTFQTPNGALVHSPDQTTGTNLEIDEWMKIDPSKVSIAPGEVVEVPLLTMIHPQSSGKKFRDIPNAWVSIEDADGREQMRIILSTQFGEFIGVQMGSLMFDQNGTHFAAVGNGFNGDFNSVLSHFS